MGRLFSFKHSATLVFAMAIVGFGSTISAFASDTSLDNDRGSLVSLGDSVTFGYNLADTLGNTKPSQFAFPKLIGEADHFSVSNLGVPGWTTDDLLHALQTPDYTRAIQSAGVLTLDIGSNDLLHIAGESGLLQYAYATGQVQLTDSQQQTLEAGAKKVSQNLNTIVSSIRAKTSAPILLYNLYNPFPDISALHAPGEQFEQIINLAAEQVAKTTPHVLYVDAHKAFDHNQQFEVRIAQGDIHPTTLGQNELAKLGEDALSPLLPTVKRVSGVTLEQAAWTIGPGGGSFSASLWADSITLNVPAGGIGSSSEADVTSTALTSLASIVPSNEKIVAEASIHLEAGVNLAKPYLLTIENPGISAQDSVYQIVGNKFVYVQGAKVTQRKAVISSASEGEFVVVEPTATTIPGGTRIETGFPAYVDGLLAIVLIGFGSWIWHLGRKRQRS